MHARRKGGPFSDLFEFCERVDIQACNRSTIETLIKAGAMDSLEPDRARLTAAVEKALQVGAAALADRKSGQVSLFGMFDEEPEAAKETKKVSLPEVPPWTEKEKLLAEKEVLGFYLASHPMAEYEPKLSAFRSHTTDMLAEVKDRSEVLVGGMISSIKFAHTKNPKPGSPSKYANFDLEDMQGVVRCILWPKQFADQGDAVQPDSVVLARAICDRRGGGDEVNLIINELIPLDQLDSKYTRGIRIELDETVHGDETLTKLREIVRGYPGYQDLLFSLRIDSGEVVHVKSGKYQVTVTPEMRGRLDDLLGTGRYRLMMSRPQVSSGGGGRRKD
jgi:DNA polymerase-3 subunit alpha